MNGKRLDLDHFTVEPGNDPAASSDPNLKRIIEELGTPSWDFGPRYSPEAEAAHIERLGLFRSEVREQVRLKKGATPSLALVDWTALNTAHQLLAHEDETVVDPFVAVGDLSAIVAAVVFYDHVIVLDSGDTAREVASLLDLDDVIRAVSPHSADTQDDRMHLLLNEHFVSAAAEFDSATTHHEPWLDELELAWKRLVPSASFPTHGWESFDTQLGYTASPDRESGSNMIFESVKGSYVFGQDDIRHLILDNDVRALFYERLAATFDYMLLEGDVGPRVRYVGGCLRSPLRLAIIRRASDYLSHANPPSSAEGRLQQLWRERYASTEFPLRLPFWMGALFERADRASGGHARPQHIAGAIRDLRKAAAPLRKRKAEVEDDLRWGRSSTEEGLRAALDHDAAALSPTTEAVTGGGVEALGAAASVFVPTPGPALVRAVARTGASATLPWLQQLSMRLFNPHLLFVYRSSADALEVRRTVEAAFDIFRFPGGNASEPLRFIQVVNETAWLA